MFKRVATAVGLTMALASATTQAIAQDAGTTPVKDTGVAAALAGQKVSFCVYNDRFYSQGAVISTPVALPTKTVAVTLTCEGPDPNVAGDGAKWRSCSLAGDSSGSAVANPICHKS